MRFRNNDSYSRSVITVPTSNFTVVSLVRFSGIQLNAAHGWLLSHGTPASTTSWSVGYEFDADGDVKGLAAVAHNVGLTTTGAGPLPKDAWIVIAWTNNGGTWQYYLEGLLAVANAGTQVPGAASGSTYINRTAISTGAGMAGDVAYIAQWNRVLTPQEHMFLGKYGSPRLIPGAQLIANMQGNDPVDVGPNVYDFAISNGTPSPGEAFRAISFDVGAATVVSTTPVGDNIEQATVYLDITVSDTQVFDATDSATVLLDLQPSTTAEEHTTYDSATIYLDLQPLGGECYSRFHFVGEGEADPRWEAVGEDCRWSTSDETRWQIDIEVQPGC